MVHTLAASQGHSEIIWAIEVSGDRVYTASADKTVRVWDLNTKRCVQVGPGGMPLLRGPRAGSIVKRLSGQFSLHAFI